jgi:curved DNA-binding protein CbpA
MHFKDIPYNLYELLAVSPKATKREINKSFHSIIINFHPDKINQKEEELYYYLVEANGILSDSKSRERYDLFLKNKNKNKSDSSNLGSNNFSDSNIRNYFPANKKEAFNNFTDFSKNVIQKHGEIKEKNLTTELSRKNHEFNTNIDIKSGNFKNMKQFNKHFNKEKSGGELSSNIMKYEDKIVPYEIQKKQNRYVDLENFNKLYLEDTIETQEYSSLNRAFMLHPNYEKSKKSDKSDHAKQNEELSKRRFNFDFS